MDFIKIPLCACTNDRCKKKLPAIGSYLNQSVQTDIHYAFGNKKTFTSVELGKGEVSAKHSISTSMEVESLVNGGLGTSFDEKIHGLRPPSVPMAKGDGDVREGSTEEIGREFEIESYLPAAVIKEPLQHQSLIEETPIEQDVLYSEDHDIFIPDEEQDSGVKAYSKEDLNEMRDGTQEEYAATLETSAIIISEQSEQLQQKLDNERRFLVEEMPTTSAAASAILAVSVEEVVKTEDFPEFTKTSPETEETYPEVEETQSEVKKTVAKPKKNHQKIKIIRSELKEKKTVRSAHSGLTSTPKPSTSKVFQLKVYEYQKKLKQTEHTTYARSLKLKTAPSILLPQICQKATKKQSLPCCPIATAAWQTSRCCSNDFLWTPHVSNSVCLPSIRLAPSRMSHSTQCDFGNYTVDPCKNAGCRGDVQQYCDKFCNSTDNIRCYRLLQTPPNHNHLSQSCDTIPRSSLGNCNLYRMQACCSPQMRTRFQTCHHQSSRFKTCTQNTSNDRKALNHSCTNVPFRKYCGFNNLNTMFNPYRMCCPYRHTMIQPPMYLYAFSAI